ncbi:flagellar basal body-associated FliL family protein [Carnobacteriaceae bacterium 52-44]
MNKDKKGFNKNILLIILAVPILVAIGVVAGNYLANDPQVVSGNETEEETFEEVSVPLEEFVLNLEPTNNVSRYIRLELSLSSTKEDGEETINSSLDKIRDVIIHTVSRHSVVEIFDDETGTITLKDSLKKALNKAFEDEVIHEVYITNIVIQ